MVKSSQWSPKGYTSTVLSQKTIRSPPQLQWSISQTSPVAAMPFVPFALSATSLSKQTFFQLPLLSAARVPHCCAQGFSHVLTLRCNCAQSSPFIFFSAGFIPPQQRSASMAAGFPKTLKAVISLILFCLLFPLHSGFPFAICSPCIRTTASYSKEATSRRGSEHPVYWGGTRARALPLSQRPPATAEASRCGGTNTKNYAGTLNKRGQAWNLVRSYALTHPSSSSYGRSIHG